MSFNLLCAGKGSRTWRKRVPMVVAIIKEISPDSFGVQEAEKWWTDSFEETLTQYARVGTFRDDGKTLGESCSIFYLKDKYELVDSGTFWLSETPEKPSIGWDAACNRICTWARLKNKETGEEYVHMNSHFDHLGITARKNSVQLILEKAKTFGDLPVVFTADMNVKEGSDNYKQFTESGYFYDTKYIAPDTKDYCTYHDTKPNSHKDDVIDYVMINDEFDAISYKVVTAGIDGRFVSDHYPIYADMIFTKD
jgi:endonuclease/exonuclease/phosphatase family metal-dependent hydrolase